MNLKMMLIPQKEALKLLIREDKKIAIIVLIILISIF